MQLDDTALLVKTIVGAFKKGNNATCLRQIFSFDAGALRSVMGDI